jgi:ligand-binding sensor domain-containing protein/DNA-binding CsgD family transcriptional regulator
MKKVTHCLSSVICRSLTKTHLFVAVFLFVAASMYAIYPSVHNFSRKESDAGTQNWDIIQHQNNWLYFANNNGLLEYDGYHWNIYPIANYTNVRSLYYDENEDKIYAGAFNEFGYYSRDNCGLLKYHSLMNLLPPEDMNFNEVWNIQQNSEFLFFQSEKVVFRMKGDRIKKLNFPHKIECSGLVHEILIISTLEDGILALNGDLFIPLPDGELLKDKKVCAILPFNEQDILFVTELNGIFLYNGRNIIPYKTDIDAFLCENQVFCAGINDSKLAFGTVRNGVVIKDLNIGENIYANVNSGLQNNTILSMAFDKQRNLWLGLDKGIDYVMINSPIYDLFGNSRTYGTGYCSIVKNNQLYLGTNQGLYMTSFPIPTSPEPFRMQSINRIAGQVWSLKEIDHTLFCGTDRGTFIINKDKAEQIPHIDGTWKFIGLQSHPGYILGSSYKGFFLLKKENNRWIYSHIVKGFDEYGGMFEEDMDGNIWFCHWMKGVYKLTFNSGLDRFSVEMYNEDKGLYTNRNNVLVKIDNEIIISSDGGFFKYNSPKEKLEHAEEYEHLFGFHPYSLRLTEMPSGDIWCVSPDYFAVAYKQSDGSFRVDTSSFSYLKNKLIIGFENFYSIDNFKTLVSTEDGFSWLDINMAQTTENALPPFQVAVKNVFITNEKDSLVGSFQLNSKEILQFEYKYNSIRFEFVAPEYRDEQAVGYSYILENYDTDWSTYSGSNTKEYTKLPKGTYTFRVKARNLLEAETAETTYKFTILPPWYETTPFIVFYVIVLMAALVLLFLYVKKKSKEGARKMEIQKEKEIQEQKEIFKADAKEKEQEIISLKNQKLQYELRHKSQELANSTMNVIRKNEILLELNSNIEKVYSEIGHSETSNTIAAIKKRLKNMQQEIKQNIERDDNWKKFAENFDIIYENYLKRLKEQFPSLSKSDLKLCAYLKMGLSSKDIAPLLNMSFRSVEMSRYRLRKKMNLNRENNLTDYLQNF